MAHGDEELRWRLLAGDDGDIGAVEELAGAERDDLVARPEALGDDDGAADHIGGFHRALAGGAPLGDEVDGRATALAGGDERGERNHHALRGTRAKGAEADAGGHAAFE